MLAQGPLEIIVKDAENKSALIDLGKTDGKETGGKEVAMGMGKKRQSEDLNNKWEKRIEV